MSKNKDDGAGQDAADRIKAATLTAVKGLSRTQAERAATAAARNVNAYGQKEEGPSRWQERKEAKRQMYLMSTEKQVRLGERKDHKISTTTVSGPASQCQKCYQTGHWTYECKNERVYISRPSRTQQLKNPAKYRKKESTPYELDDKTNNLDLENSKKKSEKKSKRKHKSDTELSNDSEASVFESESDASSVTGSDESSGESESSYSSSTDSEEERRRKKKSKKKKQRTRRHRRHSSSSESSDSESDSDSDSEDKKSRRKGKSSKGHGKKR